MGALDQKEAGLLSRVDWRRATNAMDETVTLMLKSHHCAEPEPVVVPRRIGSVKLNDLLGQGAGGAVFSGYDEALGRKVAVKLLHRAAGAANPAATAELANGIRAAAAVKHPNVVAVYAVEDCNGMPVIIMEFVDGLPLRELAARAGALDMPAVTYVLRQMLLGVDALHQANIVHRDLKPANILFDRAGVGRVCDFGLALQFDAHLWQKGVGQIGGSPLYMAPEMFDGHVSPQGDVYALGVMLFELLTSETPFSGDSISDLQTAHATVEAPLEKLAGRNLPDALCEVVRRALHKQRFMRFKTAGHMLRALDESKIKGPDEATLRRRIAQVTAGAAGQMHSVPSTAIPDRTTFDLVTRRAEEKRRQRGD